MANILELLQNDRSDAAENKPFAQVLRGNPNSQKGVGIFITAEQAEKAGFDAELALANGWTKHTENFQEGDDPVPGYLNASSRMIILRSSSIGMFSVVTKRFVRKYDDDLYKGFDGKPLSWFLDPDNSNGAKRIKSNKESYVLKTKYMVFFMGETNQFLHAEPLQLTLKGCAGASFGDELKKFKQLFGKITKSPKKPNAPFWIQTVFQPVWRSEKKQYGTGSNTSARVVGHIEPDLNDLENIVILKELHPEKHSTIYDAYTSLAGFDWSLDTENNLPLNEYLSVAPSKAPELTAEGSDLLAKVRKEIEKDESDDIGNDDIPF